MYHWSNASGTAVFSGSAFFKTDLAEVAAFTEGAADAAARAADFAAATADDPTSFFDEESPLRLLDVSAASATAVAIFGGTAETAITA